MNCIPHTYDITIQEGGTYDKDFRWSVGGVYVSLVGFTGTMQGRKKLKDDAALFSLPFVSDPWVADQTSGIYILDDGVDADLKGKYKIYIKDDLTLGLCVDHKDIAGVYTLFIKNTLGESVLKQSGILNIEASAAR